MKSLIFSLIWTMLFVAFGLYVNSEIANFTIEYNYNVDIIESHIRNSNWEDAKSELDNYYKDFHNDKGSWYKLLNHDYFDNISLSLDILDCAIFSKDKSMSLEQVFKIKATLDTILESEKCDLNHIF